MKNSQKLEKLKKQINKTTENSKNNISLTLIISAMLFIIAIILYLVMAVIVYIITKFGYLSPSEGIQMDTVDYLLFMFASSLVTGFGIAFFMKKFPMKTFDRIINQINRLASGDYSARLDFGKPFNKISAAYKISDSFNKMAEELENTEMLRSDFINNFSHEFKTPIVSISGFAKLLRRGDLTEEQKHEYLTAIEEESLRLSYMATNVLNLTKVANQSILTDVTYFNLSEQIRNSILMLEEKWTKKKLELMIDFEEYHINANSELLKQVWLNLLDNAIKFSPDYGVLGVTIKKEDEAIFVAVSNNGEEIPEDKIGKIFNRFYQADESHAAEGNGIGLAIVKNVVELHNGEIFVKCDKGVTTFTVKLPEDDKRCEEKK